MGTAAHAFQRLLRGIVGGIVGGIAGSVLYGWVLAWQGKRASTALSAYEQVILAEAVVQEGPDTTFEQMGGAEDLIEGLRETVLLPLLYPEVFRLSRVLQGPPRGVLLYGPPGCGKTMAARALAHHADATFINIHVSTLTDKWFGESNKLVAALFSLARKLEPTIIFIDEIDSFLGKRQATDHEVTSMIKAEFMSFWDGFSTDDEARVIILGATNRPNDLDEAILRRMPKRFFVPLPNASQREKILKLVLSDVKLAPELDFDVLVSQTEGFSASDIKELCREAAMFPIREWILSDRTFDGKRIQANRSKDDIEKDIRALETKDFMRYFNSHCQFKNNANVYDTILD